MSLFDKLCRTSVLGGPLYFYLYRLATSVGGTAVRGRVARRAEPVGVRAVARPALACPGESRMAEEHAVLTRSLNEADPL